MIEHKNFGGDLVAASVNNLQSQFPDKVKPVAGDTPTDIFKKLISFLASDDTDLAKGLTGLFSGIQGINFDVPEWVKRASKKTFETNGMDFFLDLKPNLWTRQFNSNCLEHSRGLLSLFQVYPCQPIR